MAAEPDEVVVIVRRMFELPEGLDGLVAAADAEGFGHVGRLAEEWAGGANRFDRPGERLLEARSEGGVLVGVGGLNVDPYAPEGERAGRLRRMYVLPAWRGRGIGRRLVQAVEAAARAHFDVLVLRTHDPDAAAFYERLGFACVRGDSHRTHARPLGGR